MISKSSLVKQIIHNCGRRIWCLFVMLLGFLVSLPLFIAGRSSQLKHIYQTTTYEGKKVLDGFFLYDAFTPNGNKYSSYMIIIAAILLGITSFCYLNSKQQVDLYHSMPISRMKLFWVRFLSGYVLFLIPYAINFGIAVVVASVQNGLTGKGNLFWMFLFQNIFFLAIYTAVCLAVIITGTLLNNVLMTAGILFIEVIIDKILNTLRALFFTTYVSYGKKNVFVTPVHQLLCMIERGRYEKSSDIYQDFFSDGKGFVNLLIWTAIALIITVVLFHKRSSEKAGKAIVFPKVELFVKMIVTTSVTYFSAEFVNSFLSVNSFGWYIFGGIAGFILSHILLEILFRGDFRAAFKHVWHWGVDAVIVCFVFISFRYDVFGYDTYLPEKEDVQSVAVSFSDLDTQIDYSNNRLSGTNYVTDFFNSEIYRLQYMELQDFEKVLELSKIGIASEKRMDPWSEEKASSDYDSYAEIYELSKEEYIQALEDSIEDPKKWSYYPQHITYSVKYTMKNGNEIYRTYTIDFADEKVRELMAAIYDQPQFKETEYPIISRLQSEDHLRAICLTTNFSMFDKKLSVEEGEQFLDIYLEELSHLSFDEIMNSDGIGHFELDFTHLIDTNNAYDYRYILSGYPLYPSFTGTIAYLEEMGVNVNIDFMDYSVASLRISTLGYYYEMDNEYCYPFVDYAGADLIDIQEIIGACDWKYNTHSFEKDNVLLEVEVEYYNEKTGESYWNYGQFKAEEIPAFVLEDMVDQLKSIEIE